MGKPALLIDAIGRERPYITIKSKVHPEGRHYELRMADELGPEQLKRLETAGTQAQAMILRVGEDASVSDYEVADAKLLQDWTEEIMEAIFKTPVEPEVLDELSWPHKIACLDTFSAVCLTSPEQQTTRAKPARKRTGAK
jgi:hypothetical protein